MAFAEIIQTKLHVETAGTTWRLLVKVDKNNLVTKKKVFLLVVIIIMVGITKI